MSCSFLYWISSTFYSLFITYLNLQIYHSRESGDGLFNEEVYDITEIETMNIIEEVDENDNEDH
jgi:hypothetical protein